jgi:hypothetical protein
MATVRITEAELARDLHAVPAKVRQGIKTPPVGGRKISEVIAAMKASGANAVLDEDFARDVEEAIGLHSR